MRTLCDILERIEKASRPDLMTSRADHGGRLMSAAEFLDAVARCASGLRELGVARGDRVGLICSNRPEWHTVDFACHRLGAVLVPLFDTLSPRQVAYCFADSGCKLVVVEEEGRLAKVAEMAGGLVDLTAILVVDEVEPQPDAAGGVAITRLSEVMGATTDPRVETDGPPSSDDLATIIYTSGTTGLPKGVMLSHRNLISNVEGVAHREPVTPEDIALSVLPLCHVYERTADYLYLAAGAAIAYSAPEELSEDFKRVRPTIMVGVPRLYQKLRDAIEVRVAAAKPFDQRVYRLALSVGMKHARAHAGLEEESLANRLLHRLLDAAVLAKIRHGTGGRMRLFSAGGAALDPALNWWYAAMGWHLLQGYGLTECSPVISGNTSRDNRIGSVGKPLEGIEVRIAEDGEILARGASVMVGYWGQPEATAATLEDGWLRTGDIGRLDPEGFLWVTDRKKAILVTSTGKNVAPGPLEIAIERSPYIEQVMVLGDGRRFVAALIVPAFGALARWAAEHGLPTEPTALCREPGAHELIEGEVQRLQRDWARYEQVHAFRLLDRPFTVENGQLTSTLKLVRRNVVAEYAGLIEEIYAA